MDKDNTTAMGEPALFAGAAWFDPIEAGLRERIRGFIEELVEQELTEALGHRRHERGGGAGHRHGRRERRLTGSFGQVEIAVPRARLRAGDGATREWRSAVLPRYARMTRQVEALIASAYLAGTNTRRVKRALAALFRGAVGKDVVSRTWRKVKADWEAWCRRGLGAEDVVRLVLDGTVVRVRLDRKATSISLLVVLGIRRDGQKVLLAARDMGGEGEAAWRAVLDDLVARGLQTPEFLIVDGAAGLEKALAALWPEVPAQRCTVHLLRHSLDFVSYKDRKPVAAALKGIYRAVDAAAAEAALAGFEAGPWGRKYPAIGQSWRRAWGEVIPFYAFPIEVRRILYTTNAIEALNSKLRRAVRARGHFPTDEAAMKLLFLVLNRAEKGSTMPPREWSMAKAQFAVLFGERFTKALA